MPRSPQKQRGCGVALDQLGLGVVVIGRNEGERLRHCIAAVRQAGLCVVYVDSGSTDGSGAWAAAQGVSVVDLDMSRPFTAARARNEGWRRLLELRPDTALVQFVDGDCEVDASWLPTARAFLSVQPGVVAVCGRRRERFPGASIYNQLCDVEWNTPIGEAKAFGGDVLIRMDALVRSGGYDPSLIAGEEPELCVRLRAAGGRIWRLDCEMTRHDAAMHSFKQWWLRTVRAGFAYAAGQGIHGDPPERHFVAETRRAVLWGGAMPLALMLSTLAWPWAACGFAIYPVQVLRLAARKRQQQQPVPWAQASFLVLGKFAEMWGCLKWQLSRFRGQPSHLIEYK